MDRFLHGFTDELIKLSAFSAQQVEADAYDAGGAVGEAMDQYQGLRAKTGLKTGVPLATAPAAKKGCGPLTTPTQLISAMGAQEA